MQSFRDWDGRTGRIAYGALVIKERVGMTDAEAAEQIGENPYLQYFLGLEEFHGGPVFDASMMVHSRGRFSEEHHRRIHEKLIAASTQPGCSDEDDDSGPQPPSNCGKLLVDASCTPADIQYPTDLGLLNDAREKTESMIDRMHARLPLEEPKGKKPRTYRQNARKQYLSVAKQKKPGRKKVRKAIGQQLLLPAKPDSTATGETRPQTGPKALCFRHPRPPR